MSAYKRLVFHFYAEKDYKENRAIKIHLRCLKFYHNIFDEAIFFIAVDDITNTDLIKSIEKDLIDCEFKNVRFQVVQNDCYREARTFYDQIICKLKTLDGMTFFGHTKGYTNYKKLPNHATPENLDIWITAMYYLSLNFIDEAEDFLFNHPRCNDFYGSFLSDWIDDNGIDHAIYSGTFYWLNCAQIFSRHYLKEEPPVLDNLAYAETYPSTFYNKDSFLNNPKSLSSHKLWMSYTINYYRYSQNVISNFFDGEKELKDYMEFKNNIINKI